MPKSCNLRASMATRITGMLPFPSAPLHAVLPLEVAHHAGIHALSPRGLGSAQHYRANHLGVHANRAQPVLAVNAAPRAKPDAVRFVDGKPPAIAGPRGSGDAAA